MIKKGEIMFEIKKIVKSNIKDVRKYLAEVPSIKEINDSILFDGLVVYLNNQIQLVVSYVINNNTALIRYFVYKRGLDEMIIKEVLQNTLYEDNEIVKKYKDNPEGLYLDYFARGKSCHVQVELPELEDVVQSIKASNGLVVLGSPKQYCGNDEELIKEILGMGFDGIEVFSNEHDEKDVKQYLEIARETNSYVSCGSNYFGKKNIQIGDCRVNPKFEKVLMTLINRCLKKVDK